MSSGQQLAAPPSCRNPPRHDTHVVGGGGELIFHDGDRTAVQRSPVARMSYTALIEWLP